MDSSDSTGARGRAAGSPGPGRWLPADRRTLTTTTVCAAVCFFALWTLAEIRWPVLIGTDQDIAAALYARVHPDPLLARGTELWTDVFGPWPMRAVSVLAAVLLALLRLFREALWAVTAMVAASTAGWVVKAAAERARPVFTDPIDTAGGFAFPSGHAIMGTVGAGIVLFTVLPLVRFPWRPIVWAAAVIVAAGTALSRTLLGVHWLSDIVAGSALGVSVLAGTLLFWTFLPPIGHSAQGSARSP